MKVTNVLDWQGGIKVEPGKIVKEEKADFPPALENNNVKVFFKILSKLVL